MKEYPRSNRIALTFDTAPAIALDEGRVSQHSNDGKEEAGKHCEDSYQYRYGVSVLTNVWLREI